MTYTVVAGAAPHPDSDDFYRGLLRGAAHVVAADAAGEWVLSLGCRPDVVVGDFDSASEGARQRLEAAGIETVVFPRHKDRTDLDLAVQLATERYAGELVLTAAFTGRLDHTLAALGDLLSAPPGTRLSEPGWDAFPVTPARAFAQLLTSPTEFSVISAGGATGVTITGAVWPLADCRLEPLSGLGVSNMTSGPELRVGVEEGTLIVLLRTANG